MVTCFAYGAISESRLCMPTAAYNIMWICNVPSAFPSDFPLTCPVSSPCHNLGHSFATCVAIAFARNASLPFRCHQCCQGLLLATQILPLNLQPVLLPRHVFARVFLLPMLPFITFAPVVFFPSVLPCRLPPPCHCHCFCPRGCPGCCHQIWAPNRALFLNFR